eukprot:1512303-Ditylum_brightwellii.AAC.1
MDDCNLFVEATKELPKGQKFNGTKESFPNFAKLVSHLLRDFRLEELLRVAVKWSNATNVKDPSETVEIFLTNRMPPEKVRKRADIPKYFKKYGATKLANTPALEADRNARRPKHLIHVKLL